MVSRQCLGHRRIPDVAMLRRETRAWAARANRRRVRIRWAFTIPKARKRFGYRASTFIRRKD